jgi:excisionase family DNA binding protein
MMVERSLPYTSEELAEEAGVSDVYIRQLLVKGKLAGLQIGIHWLIPAEEAILWIEERRRCWKLGTKWTCEEAKMNEE